MLWPCSRLARRTGTGSGFRVRDARRQPSTKRNQHSRPETKPNPLPSTHSHAGGKGRAYPQPDSRHAHAYRSAGRYPGRGRPAAHVT